MSNILKATFGKLSASTFMKIIQHVDLWQLVKNVTAAVINK